MSRTVVPIDRLAQVVGARVDEVVRAVKIELFTGVIMDTRVDTGRLRGNWQTTTGMMAMSEIERVDKIPQGSIGGAAYDEAVGGVTADGLDYLTNNLPYAEVWEERDGMIARNVARIDRIIRNKVR